MGASLVDMTVDGEKTYDEVLQLFRQKQEDDGYNYGHGGYSGSFIEFPGLSFRDDISLSSYNDAYEWLCSNSDKWRDAIAIRYTDDDGKVKWLIGGWASS